MDDQHGFFDLAAYVGLTKHLGREAAEAARSHPPVSSDPRAGIE